MQPVKLVQPFIFLKIIDLTIKKPQFQGRTSNLTVHANDWFNGKNQIILLVNKESSSTVECSLETQSKYYQTTCL